MNLINKLIFFLLILSLPALAACSPAAAGGGEAVDTPAAAETGASTGAATETADASVSDEAEEAVRPEGWTEETHSNDADLNYDVVFPQDQVNQITIAIDPADWEAMQANMTDILGEPGTGGPGGDFAPPEGMEPPEGDFAPPEGMEPPGGDFTPPGGMEPPGGDFAPPEGRELPDGMEPPGGGMPGGGGGIDMVSETPMWVPATITFDGTTWNHVGVRYKGNSSLTSAWNSGSLKMPFKFDFDEFEDDYPEIDNQRFFGFKQLSLANGFSDDSYLREGLTYQVMREAGVVGSQTALYEVHLDYGEGPVNLGIYTVVEVVDDTVIKNAFGDDDGNIYEGDGAGVSLADGTYDLIADSFEKENNEDEADWSDIEALYNVLHAETRTTDPAQWRADLEAVFDVDSFLNWLAIGAVVENWDTYGSMSHNFYLYNNLETGQLVWLPWDHNMTFGVGGGMGGRGEMGRRGGMSGRGSVSFDKAEVDESWPLIRFLLDDPVYYETYMGYLSAASDSFDAEALMARIEQMAELARPVISAVGETEQFESAVARLLEVVAERDAAVADFLAGQ